VLALSGSKGENVKNREHSSSTSPPAKRRRIEQSPLERKANGRLKISTGAAVSSMQEFSRMNGLYDPKNKQGFKHTPLRSTYFPEVVITNERSAPYHSSHSADELPALDQLTRSAAQQSKRAQDEPIAIIDESEPEQRPSSSKKPRLSSQITHSIARSAGPRPRRDRIPDIRVEDHPTDSSADELAEGNDPEHQLSSSRLRVTQSLLPNHLDPVSPTAQTHTNIPHSKFQHSKKSSRMTTKEAERERLHLRIAEDKFPLHEAWSRSAKYKSDDLELKFDSESKSFKLYQANLVKNDFGNLSTDDINDGYYTKDPDCTFLILKGPRKSQALTAFSLHFKLKVDEQRFRGTLYELSSTIRDNLKGQSP
jgi:hypothetical protein